MFSLCLWLDLYKSVGISENMDSFKVYKPSLLFFFSTRPILNFGISLFSFVQAIIYCTVLQRCYVSSVFPIKWMILIVKALNQIKIQSYSCFKSILCTLCLEWRGFENIGLVSTLEGDRRGRFWYIGENVGTIGLFLQQLDFENQ